MTDLTVLDSAACLWSVFVAKTMLFIVGIFGSLPVATEFGGFSLLTGTWVHVGNPFWWAWAAALAVWWVSEVLHHLRATGRSRQRRASSR